MSGYLYLPLWVCSIHLSSLYILYIFYVNNTSYCFIANKNTLETVQYGVEGSTTFLECQARSPHMSLKWHLQKENSDRRKEVSKSLRCHVVWSRLYNQCTYLQFWCVNLKMGDKTKKRHEVSSYGFRPPQTTSRLIFKSMNTISPQIIVSFLHMTYLIRYSHWEQHDNNISFARETWIQVIDINKNRARRNRRTCDIRGYHRHKINLKIKVCITFFGLMVVVVENFSTGLRSGDSVGCHNLFIVIFTFARVLMHRCIWFLCISPLLYACSPFNLSPSAYEC